MTPAPAIGDRVRKIHYPDVGTVDQVQPRQLLAHVTWDETGHSWEPTWLLKKADSETEGEGSFRRLLNELAAANENYRHAGTAAAALRLSAAVDAVVDYLQADASDLLHDAIDREGL